jgi:hypothetical protein
VTDAEVIARQARKLATLSQLVLDYQAAMLDIRWQCIAIGGPLNDNRDGYTPAQLRPFAVILELAEDRGDGSQTP